MRRDEALANLAAHREEILARGVKPLSLFGSVARDEAGPGSDVDLLIEFDHPVGLFELGHAREFLGQILERPVDLVMCDSIRPELSDGILREAIRATY